MALHLVPTGGPWSSMPVGDVPTQRVGDGAGTPEVTAYDHDDPGVGRPVRPLPARRTVSTGTQPSLHRLG